ncbi:MAG: flagellar protein FlaG [Rhodocyclaceae bacterium]|jgi:flagellar protein FlaG|nr:flagellar protein FlaG [Rhodocyclaceae bacterium]MCL4757147.1 flagellar protein FlaG [Rhodocyclaceae bacterium]
MSIRPIESTLPAPPPGGPARLTGESRTAPVANAQRGAGSVAQAPAAEQGRPLAQQDAASRSPGAAENGADRKELLDAVERAQKVVESQVRDMSFSIHEKTGQLIVQIIDRESKEVIRQMPAEEMLRIAEQILAMQGENQPGLLLRQQA